MKSEGHVGRKEKLIEFDQGKDLEQIQDLNVSDKDKDLGGDVDSVMKIYGQQMKTLSDDTFRLVFQKEQKRLLNLAMRSHQKQMTSTN